MDPFESIKQTFFQECDELLTDAEQGLLAMEAGDADGETINAVFRAVHSVKGGAGAFGLEDLIRFAHVFETVMDDLRSGKMELTDEVAKTLLRAFDVLADHVAAARDGGAVDEGRSAPILSEMKALIGGEGLDDDDLGGDEDFGFVPMTVAIEGEDAPAFDPPALDQAPSAFEPMADLAPEPVSGARVWRIGFAPRSEMYAKANESGLVLRELARLGEMDVRLDADTLPPLDQLSAETAYLHWTILLTTEADEATIREVFEFVEDDCDLTIEPADGKAAPPPPSSDLSDDALAAASADAPLDIAALLARVAGEAPTSEAAPEPEAVVAPEPAADLDVAALIAKAQAPIAPAAPKAVAAPVAKAAPPAANAGGQAIVPTATIRVDLDRVDRLINAVGELVIQQAMLSQQVMESGLARSSNVALGLEDLELLTREIQDSVMAIRAQPVKSVFQRMPRLAREVADMTGKRVKLVMEGEGTEVDKTVIERLTDPITHMLRNAIDHGLEDPEGRIAAGKPAEGVVRLRALHRGGRIVIELQDDGRGINRPRVRGIAIERGLIAEDAVLSDEEVDNLIFLPGFSTADTISDISGRGVGMDVVRRSIQGLGGRITISSEPGKGSKFTMSLPLTLAVLDGMVVTAAEQTLVAPLSAIIESLTPRAEDVHFVGGKDAVIRIRETFVPLIDVGVALGFRETALPPGQGVAVLVESEGGGKAALLVEAIQGQRQVVIKSLEANYQQIDGIAAATILGDGRVALILDVDALVTTQHRRKAPPRAEKRMAG
ncbi:chemotaxis protein CheA [Phenylobacterium sp. LH3H17]|uniref:chemotaxis protein CheA n=1 Tax=Phenylobacterium sp. LH3H17 TaxID=2903901 RepID=UPI0020C942D2|nr:chemotaxis protein CheA [Phenylobacterium sp. LH3H17]UTP40295.1 chemotaxis protein CheA [Phenylobacterium sp. LH3H17]